MQLIHGDCLEKMKDIPDKSIDMIICDLPYGTTACKWDVVIPFAPLWEHYKRVIKDRGAIVLFGNQPFTTLLIASNIEMFKYSLVWHKSRATYFAQAPYRFMQNHEDILVFSKGNTAENAKLRMNYYPQGLVDIYKIEAGGGIKATAFRPNRKERKPFIQTKTSYPRSILQFNNEGKTVHPTQKPVTLLEYLIKTYTLEGETVLDNCMGSGSTGIACVNTKRNFIGIEKDDKYFEIAKNRINNHLTSVEGDKQELAP